MSSPEDALVYSPPTARDVVAHLASQWRRRYVSIEGLLIVCITVLIVMASVQFIETLAWPHGVLIVPAVGPFLLGEAGMLALNARESQSLWALVLVVAGRDTVVIRTDDVACLNAHLDRRHLVREGRLLWRWARAEIPVHVLTRMMKAGMSRKDVKNYLDADPGSSTREGLECLLALKVTS